MPDQTTKELGPEIGQVLFIDTVGFSRLLMDEQLALLETLNRVVRDASHCQLSAAAGKLIRIPTGDGMALVFFDSPEAPAQCALEISRALRHFPHVQVRMGIHCGPVSRVSDVNEGANITGAGINIAQRVMSCADGGHILLSKHCADDLVEYQHWKPYLHELGQCSVKGGATLSLVNLYTENAGNPAIPEKVALGRAESKQVSPRWKSYRWVALILAILLLSLFLVYPAVVHRMWQSLFASGAGITNSPFPEKSLAILPFENLSDDKNNRYFADGVLEELLTNLSTLSALKVTSRTSVMGYPTSAPRNLKEIAKQLGVNHIVEGSVQRIGNRVRVSVQLIDAKTDSHIWAGRYDRLIEDVFALESELAQQIASSLRIELTSEEKSAIEEKPTSDLLAYEYYVRARTLLDSSGYSRYEETLLQAVQLLKDAVDRDPGFFLAYCELATAHDRIYLAGVDHSNDRLTKAATALEKAQSLRSLRRGDLHLALAEHRYCGYFDFAGAMAELSIARQMLPNDSRVLQLSGFIERRRGKWEESMRDTERAHDLDPRNFYILQQIALSYGYLRQYKKELSALDRALEIVPMDQGARLQQATVEISWHANTKPFHATLEMILSEDPAAAASLAGQWIELALLERDINAAKRALRAMGPDGSHYVGLELPRSWSEGVVARAAGDNEKARAEFTAARVEVAKKLREYPDDAELLSVLAMIDANLDRKADAIYEGKRAIELLPVTRDSINGALLLQNLAYIYVRTGEKALACEQLAKTAQVPGDLSFGQLQLHPDWDPLRDEPRFREVLNALERK